MLVFSKDDTVVSFIKSCQTPIVIWSLEWVDVWLATQCLQGAFAHSLGEVTELTTSCMLRPNFCT
jgi:hypothetical protein